jgi:hypothetical protein
MYGSDNVTTPTRYGVLLQVMKEYGWSWRDLCEAPNDLVDEISVRIAAEQYWTAEKRKFDEQMDEARAALNRR